MGSILLGTQFHHTAYWQPSLQGLPSWQQMGNQQQWQHSTYHQGSNTIQHKGSILLGTQYHHIACWQPSLQGLSSWQQMGSQQQWQHSTYHLGSSTIQHMGSILLGTQCHTLLVGSHLGKVCLLGNKWAVSSSGSAVHAIWAAVPSNIWAASSWALSTITLLVGSHLGKGCLLGNKWAVSSSGSAVHTIWAA